MSRVPPKPPSARQRRRARELKVDPQAILDRAYERAVRLHAELEQTPRWRWRRRAELTDARARACHEADGARDALGITGEGALPLLTVLQAQGDRARLPVKGSA